MKSVIHLNSSWTIHNQLIEELAYIMRCFFTLVYILMANLCRRSNNFPCTYFEAPFSPVFGISTILMQFHQCLSGITLHKLYGQYHLIHPVASLADQPNLCLSSLTSQSLFLRYEL